MFTRRSFEIFGLASRHEVINSLLIGVPVILLGYLIVRLSWWNKTVRKRNTESSVGNVVGCLGLIIMLAGAIFLFPLLMWLEAIANGIFTFGMAAVAVVAVIAGIIWLCSWMMKKIKNK